MAVVATKLDRLSQKLPVVHNCRHILQRLGSPTVLIARDWIDRLGASTDRVCKGEEYLCVWELIDALDPEWYAHLVPLRFVGGPPKGRGLLRTYKGSLYTFLIDRILYYIEEVGLEVTESVLGIPRKACKQC